MIKTTVTGQSQAAVIQMDVTGAPDIVHTGRTLAPASLTIRYGLRQGSRDWVVSDWNMVCHRRLKDGSLGASQSMHELKFKYGRAADSKTPDWVADVLAWNTPDGYAGMTVTGWTHEYTE